MSLLSDRLGVTVSSDEKNSEEKSNAVFLPPQKPKKTKPPKERKKQKIKKEKLPKEKPETENLLTEVKAISEMDELTPPDIEKVNESAKKDKRILITGKVGLIAVSLVCVYMVFLIFGAIMTPFYRQSENTKAYPVVMSVEDIRKKEEYEKLYNLFLTAKEIYEEVIMIDYRLSTGSESDALIAADYTAVLEKTSSLYTSINAVSFSKEYTPVVAVLEEWVYTDMPVYLQNVSNALILDDTDTAQQAIIGQTVVETNFTTLQKNVLSLAEGIKAVDLSEIEDWSVEKYRKEQVGFVTEKE